MLRDPAVLSEVAFVGREADGGIIGLWRYDAKVPSDSWPVVYVDSEGQVSMPARTLQQLFEKRDRSAKTWFRARGFTAKPPAGRLPSIAARLEDA